MIQKFKLLRTVKNEKYLLCAVFLALSLITFFVSHEPTKVESPVAEIPEIDEFIPAGYVLWPIELVNREALAAIVGATAVVDILTVSPNTLNPQTKIASRVKMLRSPKNPDYFALLIEESASADILKKPGPYFALVQNKKQTKANFYKDRIKTKIEIQYQE